MTNHDKMKSDSLVTPHQSLPDIINLFTEGWRCVRNNLTLVAILSIPFAVLEIITYFSEHAVGLVGDTLTVVTGIGSVIALITYVLLMATSLFLLTHRSETPSFALGFAWAKQNFWSLIWLSILSGLIVCGGFLLLIVPGIIVGVYICLSQMVLVKEGKTGLAALLRSRELVYGNWWAVVVRIGGVQLLYFAVMIGIGLLLGTALVAAAGLSLFTSPDLGKLITNLLFTVLGSAGTVILISVTLRLYTILSADTAPEDIPSANSKYTFLAWLGFFIPIIVIVLMVMGMFANAGLPQDAAKSEQQFAQKLDLMQFEADKYYTTQSAPSYAGVCAQTKSFFTDEQVQCNESNTAYALAVTQGDQVRCIDSTGYNKIIYTDLQARTQCLDI